MGERSVRRRLQTIGMAALTLAGAIVPAGGGASAGGESATADLVKDARCGAAYRLAGVGVDIHGVRCTHGPDPAPGGATTGHRRTTDELAASASTTTSTSTADAAVPCYGDGTTGNRVQAVYARAADVPDRYDELATMLPQWAAAADAVFADSAAETGGVRHVRWVTDAGCNLVVHRVTLSTAGDDTMSNTINELRAQGLNRSDRKYLVWMDAAVFCGMSEHRSDDTAGPSNANNFGPSVARVDSICWGRGAPVEAHELMHALGGVQDSAPHSTGQAHCTDESDIMCYPDSSGMAMTYACESAHEARFDCNHDDYYSTAPPAGTYLATHWNSASSSFLATAAPGGSAESPSSTPTPAPLTATYSGSVTRRAPSMSFAIVSGSGPMSARLQFGRRAVLTMSVIAPDGTVVASTSGSSSLTLSTTLAAASYRLVVSTNGGNASFTLDVTYPAP